MAVKAELATPTTLSFPFLSLALWVVVGRLGGAVALRVRCACGGPLLLSRPAGAGRSVGRGGLGTRGRPPKAARPPPPGLAAAFPRTRWVQAGRDGLERFSAGFGRVVRSLGLLLPWSAGGVAPAVAPPVAWGAVVPCDVGGYPSTPARPCCRRGPGGAARAVPGPGSGLSCLLPRRPAAPCRRPGRALPALGCLARRAVSGPRATPPLIAHTTGARPTQAVAARGDTMRCHGR